MRRPQKRVVLQAKQISIFPALLIVEADDVTGRATVHPLPLDRQWRLAAAWLTLLLGGWAAQVWQGLTQATAAAGQQLRRAVGRLAERICLELHMSLILTRQFSLAALGR